jgi:DNA-binding transcriptional MerR regulator/effector-binding domain-containing protein
MAMQLTIGDFARITHLSVKTLRHYHRVGLLEPDEVNESTGYRYYSVGQVQTAHTIRRFRDLDMPVDEVRAVLNAPDVTTRHALLAAHLDRMQAQLEQTQAAVASLRSLIEAPPSPIEVTHRSVHASHAIAIRDTVERADLVMWWATALDELHAVRTSLALRATGAAGGLFADELFTDERGEALVFIPVAGPAPAVGNVHPFTVPSAELAVTVHKGSHQDMDRTYGALGSYVTERGIGIEGPVREYYLTGAAETTDVTQWRTEVCWPI